MGWVCAGVGIPDRGGYARGAGIREGAGIPEIPDGAGIPEIPEGVGIPEEAGTLGDRYMRGEGGYIGNLKFLGILRDQYTRGGSVYQGVRYIRRGGRLESGRYASYWNIFL